MGQSILTPEQKLLLDRVLTNPKITDSYYLTGGTALSEFYFQHRLSEDFDFFSEEPIVEKDILYWVKEISQQLKIEEVEYKNLRGQLTFFFHFPQSVVKVDFAQYPFPHVGIFKNYHTLRIASLLDIGVNKLQAIQTRKRGRDFFDLYYLLNQEKLAIKELLQNYRNKFGITLSPQELAKYFMGILEATDQPRFLGKVDWSKIENFFIQEAKTLSETFLEK